MSWSNWVIAVCLVIGVPQLFYLSYVLQIGFNAVCASNASLLAAIEAVHDTVRDEAQRNVRRDAKIDFPDGNRL